MNKNRLKLPNGNYLVITQNEDMYYSFEMFIDIENADGVYLRPVAIVRPSYVSLNDTLTAEPLRKNALPWKNGENGILKDRFEVLFPTDNEEFEKVEFPVVPVLYDWRPYTTLRKNQECGMAPANVQQSELCYIPLYDGYGISAVANEQDGEVYVGVKSCIYWWQNLCRFRLEKGHLHTECFSEWSRGYDIRQKPISYSEAED